MGIPCPKCGNTHWKQIKELERVVKFEYYSLAILVECTKCGHQRKHIEKEFYESLSFNVRLKKFLRELVHFT